MFPTYIKIHADPTELPGQPIYFVLAENGIFLVKDMELYRASVKVEGVTGLLPHAESVELKFPKLPKVLVETVMGFFYEVYERYESEAILLLFFSISHRSWNLGAPKQQIAPPKSRWSSSHYVNYENFAAPEGFLRLGTWHSHADLPAYHSRRDDEDEEDQDGLHIVCGDLDQSKPSFSFSFTVNGKRFRLERDDIFAGYEKPISPSPKCWLEQVECVSESRPKTDAFDGDGFRNNKRRRKWVGSQ